MVKPKPPTECRPDRDEEGAVPAVAGASPMARFKTLTKQLLNVSPEQVREERREFVEKRSSRSEKEPGA